VGQFLGTRQEDLRGNVPVGRLSFGNHIDPVVHRAIQFRIARHAINGRGRFDPFVAVAVAPVVVLFSGGENFNWIPPGTKGADDTMTAVSAITGEKLWSGEVVRTIALDLLPGFQAEWLRGVGQSRLRTGGLPAGIGTNHPHGKRPGL
jgi:hypothetical protein